MTCLALGVGSAVSGVISIIVVSNSFFSKSEARSMNIRSGKKLCASKKNFKTVKAEMNDLIANELRHATAGEKKALEAHFLAQVKERAATK